jgi:hypothetical protein
MHQAAHVDNHSSTSLQLLPVERTGVMSKCCRSTGFAIVAEGASGPMACTKYWPIPVGQLLSHLSDALIGRRHSTVTMPFLIEQAVKATLLAVEFFAKVESPHAPYAV